MEKKIIPNLFQSSEKIFSLNGLADIYNNKGLKFLQNNDYENAIACFFQSLDYDNNYAHAYSNIGNALLQKGNYDEAVKMYKDAIKLDKNNSIYHYNLGVALTQCNDNKSAAEAYKDCLKINPKNSTALKFLGNCYNNLKMFPEALNIYRKWEKLDKNNPEPNFLQGQIHIRHGRFNVGWKLYEYGLKNNIRKPFKGYYDEIKPLWNGKPFDGTLLVYGEQGIGDQINFGTLIPELLEVQKKIIIKVDSRLKDIFKNTFPNIEVVDEDNSVNKETYDKYISLVSLCKIFRNHTDKFINTKFDRYIVSKKNNPKIKEFFSGIKGLKVGISWCSFSEKNGAQRSLSTDDLAKVTRFRNINFINIQYGNVLKQVKEVKLLNGREILKVPFTDLTRDINSVASIIQNCDLIISVDNSTAHLAASMGKPIWILLPFSSEFRWMENITPALWYRNATLLRQAEENNWSNVVDLVCKSIEGSNLV